MLPLLFCRWPLSPCRPCDPWVQVEALCPQLGLTPPLGRHEPRKSLVPDTSLSWPWQPWAELSVGPW